MSDRDRWRKFRKMAGIRSGNTPEKSGKDLGTYGIEGMENRTDDR